MAGLEGTLKTPVGTVQKKTALYVGGAAVGIGAIVYFREKKLGTATTTTDTTGDQSLGEIDPATGFVYGSPEDTAALANQGGSLGVGGVTNTGGGSTVPTSGVGYVSNGQWSQAAIEYMTANGLVADPTQLSAALGKYIAGQYADDTDVQLIDQAIAIEGFPPIAGANGYPPSINRNPTPVTGGSTPPTGTTVPRPPAPKASNISRTGVTLSIPAQTGATMYEWSVNGANHAHTNTPSYHYSAKPGTRYSFTVTAYQGSKGSGSSPATIVTTPK